MHMQPHKVSLASWSRLDNFVPTAALSLRALYAYSMSKVGALSIQKVINYAAVCLLSHGALVALRCFYHQCIADGLHFDLLAVQP